MPRKGPGGIRTGTPGKAYSNRTDMNQNQGSTQPIAAAPNQPYGAASAQKAAQQTIPLPVAAAPIKPFRFLQSALTNQLLQDSLSEKVLICTL